MVFDWQAALLLIYQKYNRILLSASNDFPNVISDMASYWLKPILYTVSDTITSLTSPIIHMTTNGKVHVHDDDGWVGKFMSRLGTMLRTSLVLLR